MSKPSGRTKQIAAILVTVLTIAIVAAILYAYTSEPTPNSSVTITNGSQASSSNTSSAPIAGYQDNSGQPQGAWADYLGFIPAGYSLAPHQVNANVYPCPSGMNAAQCTQFKATCGNGVCDPNESCATCAIDCGIPGSLTCDPYTGRAGSPVSVCQVHR